MGCFNRIRYGWIFCYEHQIYFKKGQECPKCKKEGYRQTKLYKIKKEK